MDKSRITFSAKQLQIICNALTGTDYLRVAVENTNLGSVLAVHLNGKTFLVDPDGKVASL